MMTEEEKIIAKIQKLLALSESLNKYEAERAMTKAQDLILRYNISESNIKDNLKGHWVKEGIGYTRIPVVSKFVCKVVAEAAMVNSFTSSRYRQRRIMFFGRESNVKMAIYLYKYLCTVFVDLWKKYKKENNFTNQFKQAYFAGLEDGIMIQLEEQKQKIMDENVENCTAIVKTSTELQNAMDEQFNLRPAKKFSINMNDIIMNDGKKHGQEINLNRPLNDGEKIDKILI